MSTTCPVCRIKTNLNEMLKLFFEETPMVDVPKLIKENHKLTSNLEDKEAEIESLKFENDILQKQLEELKAEKEEHEKSFKRERRASKRTMKEEEKEKDLLNCTIDLTYSPPPTPQPLKKRSKRNGSNGDDAN
uniref:Uncharacterized protein n=1 Tax=Panagrolaimus sp. ES5 TaxID=591445 RepID=A0AC34F3B5_9BILA